MTSPSIDTILKGLVNSGLSWSGGVVTYSFPSVGSNWSGYFPTTGDFDYLNEPYRNGFTGFSEIQKQSFRDTLAQWAELIPVTFVETDDKTQPGDIRAAITRTQREYKAYGPPAKGSSGVPANGDIWINQYYKDLTFKVGWDFEHGDFVMPILLQAIGVALGLNIYDLSNKLNLPAEFDTTRYTIMSWNNPLIQTYTFGEYFNGTKNALNTNGYAVAFSTPMVFDILAIQSIYGVNTKTRAGNDTYSWTENKAFFATIFDGGGIDTIDLTGHARGSIIDLTPGAYSSIDLFTVEQQKAFWTQLLPQYTQQITAELDRDAASGNLYTGANNLGIAYSTIIENVEGGSGDDVIIGNNVDNVLHGNGGADRISGGGGDDHLSGGAGDDILDGGTGLDEAVYSGKLSDYALASTPTGWVVVDGRAGSPDGRDVLTSIEMLTFSDGSIKLANPVVATALSSILRESAVTGDGGAQATDLSAKLASGLVTQDGVTAAMVKAAQATTSVATLTYEFFTGKIPSQLGIDYLVSPTGPNPNGNINGPLYNYFNTVNRYINFAVALGKNGEAKDSFAAEYGSLSLFEATRHAYAEIFGGTPNDAKVHQLLDTRVDFLAGVGGDGPEGIGTKAAMVGFLLAAAATESIGVMAKANEAWLTDLADGSAPFAIDILDPAKGYYKADYVFGG